MWQSIEGFQKVSYTMVSEKHRIARLALVWWLFTFMLGTFEQAMELCSDISPTHFPGREASALRRM